MMPSELCLAALQYASWGWPVFPVMPDKKPRTKHGFKDASRSPDLIEEWWRRWPDSGIGMAVPEGLLVLDIDPRNGGVRGPELPETKEAGTRSGGAHLYYGVPPDLHFAGQYQQGIDIKAPGRGYVILPPTPGYVWTRRGPLALLPNDVLESCSRVVRTWGETVVEGVRFLPWESGSRYGKAALRDQVEQVRSAHEGERNLTLFKATCALSRLIAGGELREDPTLKALFEAALEAGLEEDEVLQTIESGYAAGIDEPRRAPR